MTTNHALVAALVIWLAPLSFSAAQGAPPPKMSPRAEEMVAAWRAGLAEIRARQAALPRPKDVADDLARRAELDAEARQGVAQVLQSDLPAQDKGLALRSLFQDIGRIDADNTDALRRALPSEGWFRPSIHGAKLAQDAWLIVQHSPDATFRAEILARMGPLLASGDLNARDYALLYDRVRTEQKQPQRFASQAQCSSGKWAFYPVDEMAAVDRRRREIGWSEPLAGTEARLRIGSAC